MFGCRKKENSSLEDVNASEMSIDILRIALRHLYDELKSDWLYIIAICAVNLNLPLVSGVNMSDLMRAGRRGPVG